MKYCEGYLQLIYMRIMEEYVEVYETIIQRIHK